jgi:DNA-binding protein YbaB
MFNNIKKTAGLVSNAHKIKQQRDKLSKLLSSIRVTGTSKNGKVTATLTGEQTIVDINIDPSLINFVYENFTSKDKEDTMLKKSIMEAISDGLSKVQEAVVKKMQEDSSSMGDLMSMLQTVSGGGQ